MEDYWENYDSYDQVSAELKESLINSVRKEITDKMTALEKENANLKERQNILSSLEEEARIKRTQLDREIASAQQRVKYEKAKELFREITETKYCLTHEFYKPDKCDKCDDKRQLPFMYPSGKEGVEACVDCGSTKSREVVSEAIGTSIDIRSGELMIWYRPYKSWEDEEYSSMSGDIMKLYNGEDFADLVQYRTLFKDKEVAQRYADYLNEKKAS